MERYLLFAGDDHYPAGGWGDFKGDFNTIKQAKNAIIHLESYDWEEIIDTETMKGIA